MFVYGLLGFTFDGAPPRGLTMVVNLFPLGQGDLALDQVFLQINSGRNQREPFFLNPARQFIELLAVKQKTPIAKRIVIGVAPRRIRADMTIDQPSLALLDVHITVFEIDFPVANRLHLRARQFHSRLKPLEQMVQVLRLPVDGKVFRRGLGGLGHSADARKHLFVYK